MSKTRKILSVVLSLVLVVALAVPAFAAAGFEEAGNTYTQSWSLALDGANDHKALINLATNYPTGAIQFQLVLTGDLAISSVALGSGYYAGSLIQHNASNKSIIIVPNTAGVDSADATAINGTVAEVTFTGNGTVTIDKAQAKSESNPGGNLIAARVNPADLVSSDSIVGQTIVGDINVLNIGAVAAEADLALKAGAAAGVTIDTHKFTSTTASTSAFGYGYDGAVYGFVRTATATFRNTTYLNANLEATNGGSLEYVQPMANSYGTGTLVKVLNADGTLSKTYVIVIFGDVDKNGFVNGTDVTVLKRCQNDSSYFDNNSIERFAGNVNNVNTATIMHRINGNDTTALKNYTANSASANSAATKLDAVTLAETMFKFNTNYQ